MGVLSVSAKAPRPVLAPVWERGQRAAHVPAELNWRRGGSGWVGGRNWVGEWFSGGPGLGWGWDSLGCILGLIPRLRNPDSGHVVSSVLCLQILQAQT